MGKIKIENLSVDEKLDSDAMGKVRGGYGGIGGGMPVGGFGGFPAPGGLYFGPSLPNLGHPFGGRQVQR